MSIATNLSDVLTQIEQIKAAHQISHKVELLAVSKMKPYEDIKEAYQAGQRLFGESYAQEAVDKIKRSKEEGLKDLSWFFIGPLQSNKTRQIAENFDWVLSCDRAKLLQRLNDQRPDKMRPLNICLQVNISNEDQKQGMEQDQVQDLAKLCNDLPNLVLRGVMGIALNTTDNTILQNEFTQLKNIFLQLQASYHTVDTLSMGMSADMSPAISCGSNLVRIGTRIFGERNYNKG